MGGATAVTPPQFSKFVYMRLDDSRPNCYSAPIMLTKPVYFYFYFFSQPRRTCCEVVVTR